jgi:hypothetical protein
LGHPDGMMKSPERSPTMNPMATFNDDVIVAER